MLFCFVVLQLVYMIQTPIDFGTEPDLKSWPEVASTAKGSME